jgi:hypothetical protein
MVLGYVSVYQLTWLSIALLLCAATEVWGRWRFYGRYARVGL